MREHQMPAQRRQTSPQNGYTDPFSAFRQEMDRLFEDFFSPARMGGFEMGAMAFRPAIDLDETEKEVQVRAELPGVEEKDVEISLEGDVLSIRGEKREERTDEGGQRRVVERSYGAFERQVRLPFEPREDQVRAEFNNGVLTVTAQKPPELAKSSKRIPIGKA